MAGIGAVIIKNSVHFIKELLTGQISGGLHSYLYFAYPIVGILIAVLFIRFIIKSNVGHGIPATLHAISKKKGVMQKHNVFSSIVTATFTVGCGGSAGLEG
ncbi:chloride channel protein, partial [Streptococcus pseudopneumoniae]|uniref:chloride channel protein n=1 Tax=Streptococcus pseudopneumoniae TaxID=257758 RepID=UPI001485CBD7